MFRYKEYRKINELIQEIWNNQSLNNFCPPTSDILHCNRCNSKQKTRDNKEQRHMKQIDIIP